MKSIQHILVPTDFSDNAAQAYPFAMEMALKYKADVTFLLVLEKPYDFSLRANEHLKILIENAEEIFQELTDSFRNDSKYSDVNIDYKVVLGKVVSQIMNISSDLDSDLIVMATKGTTGLKKILFGSTASALITETNTPVLVIPEEADFKDFEKMVFVTEYHDQDIELLKATFEFSEDWNSHLEILHINDLSDLKSESLFHGFNHIAEKTLKTDKLLIRSSNNTDLSDSVEEYEETEKPSIIVLGNNKKGIFQRFLDNAEVNQVGNISTTPVLVLPVE